MKCARCGAELKEGYLYCSVCGYESKIEPDYTEFEDEYFQSILQEKDAKEEQDKKVPVRKRKAVPNRTLLAAVCGGVFFVLLVVLIVTVSIRQKNASSYDYQVQKAEQMQSEGKEEQAIEYYQNALSLKPDDIPVRFAMAELLEDGANTDAALVLYMDILSLDSANEEAYRKVIAIYDARGDYDSILALEQTIKSDSLLELFADYHVTEPTLSPSVGEYDEYIEVVPFSVDSYDIYYTKDGSDPTTDHGQLYDSDTQIMLEKNGTYVIKAVCRNEKGVNSDVVSGTYVIGVYPPAYATLEPDGGHVDSGQTVAIEAESGCTIYYTWDGTDPTELSDQYFTPLEIPEGNSVLSVLVVNKKTGLSSGIYRSNFIVD